MNNRLVSHIIEEIKLIFIRVLNIFDCVSFIIFIKMANIDLVKGINSTLLRYNLNLIGMVKPTVYISSVLDFYGLGLFSI